VVNSKRVYIYVSNPILTLQSIPHRPVLSSRGYENQGGDDLRRSTIQPRGGPKGSFRTIANGDPSSGVEKISIGGIIRGFRSYPRFFRRVPLIPQPSESERARELLQVQDPKSTQISWTADFLPVDLAFPPADDFLAGPKHTATDLGEGL
jgi:hypothetical protein